MDRPATLPSLTGLRFVAALAVFGFHIAWSGIWASGPISTGVAWLLRGGASGVSFFFVLSGFVLTWSARPQDSTWAFLRRRLVKIYPSHIVMWGAVLVWLAWLGLATPVGSSFASLFLVQAWSADPAEVYSVNVVSWSLSCEVFFYLLFPALLTLVRRVRGDRLLLLAVALCATIIAVPALLGPVPGLATFSFTFPPIRLLEFVLGVVLARMVAEDRWIDLPAGLAAAALAVALLLAPHVPSPLRSVALTIVPIALLIPAVARRDLTGSPSWWRSRTAVYLGELSFGFYLVHHFMIRLVIVGPGLRDLSPLRAAVVALLALVLSAAGAYALHRWVELPFVRHFSRAGTRMPTPVAGLTDPRP